jgi:hypothetical protein
MDPAMKIVGGRDVIEVGDHFEGGYLYVSTGSPGNDWGEVSLGPAQIDQLIAHLIEVRGASRVQELLNKPE